MSALDLSAYAPPEEHPDVTALKKRVVDVMKKYTSQHGWCDEARRAMVEAGVIDARENTTLAIRVTLKQGFELTPVANVTDLIGKSEVGQKDVLANIIGTVNLRSASQGVLGSFVVTGDDITEMTMPTLPEPGWRKASDNSRVLHHFTAEALAQAESGRSAWAYPACGMDALASIVRRTNIGSVTKHCVKCEKRLANQ